jgi:hypothetical protein
LPDFRAAISFLKSGVLEKYILENGPRANPAIVETLFALKDLGESLVGTYTGLLGLAFQD